MAGQRTTSDLFGIPDASLHDLGVLELSWEVFGELSRALAVNVAREFDPELVIGIATAGVIPGAVTASILRRDFFALKISRRSGRDVPDDQPRLLTSAPSQARGRRVLIVDEICTTGETLRMALAAVRAVNPTEVRTATSIVKAGRYRPDYYTVETDATVIFPWDRQVVGDGGELVKNPRYEHLL
ncbi:MAG: phosphoribosyltransferase [Gemmatimonadota bacterium]